MTTQSPNNKSNKQTFTPLLNLNKEKPHDEYAEIAVLGAMMLSPDAAASALTALHDVKNAFYNPVHQIIFDAIAVLASTAQKDHQIDYVVLSGYLKQQGQLDLVGGISYLASLGDRVPTAKNIDVYVENVKQTAILRRIIEVCSQCIFDSYEATDNSKTLVDSIEREIFAITQMNETQDYKHISEIVNATLADFQRITAGDVDMTGLKTGFAGLDDMIIGLKPGDLFVLAARPSVGKTALALNIAANIALRGKCNDGSLPGVGIFSLEMTSKQLVQRLIQSEARVNLRKIERGINFNQNELRQFKNACATLDKSNIVIDDTGGINILELRAKARRMKSHNNISCIIIDYLQLITIDSSKTSNRENDVSRISSSLKALAKELNVPIIVLSQLNRQAEKNKDERPQLSNLRESGAIEQDADVVALLHRTLAKQQQQGEDDDNGLQAELIVAKNRNGRIGVEKLVFFPQFTLYEQGSEVADEDVPR